LLSTVPEVLKMMTQQTRRAGYLALAIAVTGLFAMAPSASAQYSNTQPNRWGRGMAIRSYERMRQYARQLDDLAREANRQAHLSQSPFASFFGRDTKFLREIEQFAARARQFRARMDTYQTRPWNVDDELAGLLQDAQDVSARLRRARFADRRTISDWNRAVSLLNQMTTEYQAGIGYRGRRGYRDGDTRVDAYPEGVDPRTAPGPDAYPNSGDYRGNSNPNYGNYANSTDLRQLAAELDQRAARASQLANGYSGFSPDIIHFSEQARDFRDQVESNRMSRSELRTEVNHLLEDAQSAQSELRQRNISRSVAQEWDGIVQILSRMRDLAV
jgi:chromosome segregation ATPase